MAAKKAPSKAQQAASKKADSQRRVMSAMPDHVKAPTQPVPVSGERVKEAPAKSPMRNAPVAMTDAERGTARAARAERRAWEATEAGQARTKDISQLTQEAGTAAAGRPQTAVPVGMIHFLNNYGKPATPGPRHYDVQLPGMADPDAAPRPPRWEELSPEQRAHTERALSMRGTSVDQISKDLGAQFDQATWRAQNRGADKPYAEDFYSTGEPRKVIEQSARDLGIPATIHAQMNAFTSPNTKFSRQSGGQTVYPNDIAAKHAVLHAQAGGTPESLSNELRTTGLVDQDNPTRAQGYTTNMRKASSAFSQYMEGVAPADWVTGTDGAGPFDSSPKTGPYANSWSDSHPQFFVSDVHSGGGGAFPHLGSEKPIKTSLEGQPVLDKQGKPVRDKSRREAALESVPNSHSAIDFAARQAMVARNLGSTRDFQAAQWGEEQIQRGEAASRRGDPRLASNFPSEAEAYRERPRIRQIPGQASLDI